MKLPLAVLEVSGDGPVIVGYAVLMPMRCMACGGSLRAVRFLDGNIRNVEADGRVHRCPVDHRPQGCAVCERRVRAIAIGGHPDAFPAEPHSREEASWAGS